MFWEGPWRQRTEGLLGLQSDLGYSLCSVRGRRNLLTGEIVPHGAQLNTSAGLMSLKELLVQGPKALGQDPWKSNWVWRIWQRL